MITVYKLGVYALAFVVMLLCITALYLLVKVKFKMPALLLKPVGVIGFVVYYLVRAIVKKEKLKKVIPGMLLGVLRF